MTSFALHPSSWSHPFRNIDVKISGKPLEALPWRESFDTTADREERNADGTEYPLYTQKRSLPGDPGPCSTLLMKDLLVPTSTGKIKHILMTYDPSSLNDSAVVNSYLSAFRKMAEHLPDARFTIIAGRNHSRVQIENTLKDLLEKGKIKDLSRFNVVMHFGKISIWAQDSVLVQGNTLLQLDRGLEQFGLDDGAVAPIVAGANPEFESKDFPSTSMAGGNTVSSPDYLLIGSDAVLGLAGQLGEYPQESCVILGKFVETVPGESKEGLIARVLQTRFPLQKILVIGSPDEAGVMVQPSFHIDMAVTLLGKDSRTGKPVALVGDPSIAVEAIRKTRRENADLYRAVNLDLKKTMDPPDDPLAELEGMANPRWRKHFDDVAKALEQEGFLVERIPHLGKKGYAHRLPWITYNNVLIDEKRVFMPVFGFPPLDDSAKALYEKYGYEVIPVDSVGITSGQGALNCITKILERELPQA
ncbi:MAG: agmatine deiminase family protein [Armatimonadetes bacterium]|nr:agmatine deiminase family protein [Armatimonadota bacterium]